MTKTSIIRVVVIEGKIEVRKEVFVHRNGRRQNIGGLLPKFLDFCGIIMPILCRLLTASYYMANMWTVSYCKFLF